MVYNTRRAQLTLNSVHLADPVEIESLATSGVLPFAHISDCPNL